MRSRPQRALVTPRTRIRAREFLNELGGLMYGETWKDTYINCLYPDQIRGSTNDLIGGEQSACVCTDFIEAVTVGIAETEVYLSDLQISQLFREVVVNFDELSPLDDATFDERLLEGWSVEEPQDTIEQRIVKAGYYHIPKSYWDTDFDPDDIDWRLSNISIPPSHVVSPNYFMKDSKRYEYNNISAINVPLYVANPDLVLSDVSEIPPLLTPALVEQYKRVHSYFWAEITAATWRFLAQNPEDRHGKEADIILVLWDYMQRHQLHEHGNGFGPSESTMKAVVGKILRQWRIQDTQSRVLVSSTARVVPDRRPKSRSD